MSEECPTSSTASTAASGSSSSASTEGAQAASGLDQSTAGVAQPGSETTQTWQNSIASLISSTSNWIVKPGVVIPAMEHGPDGSWIWDNDANGGAGGTRKMTLRDWERFYYRKPASVEITLPTTEEDMLRLWQDDPIFHAIGTLFDRFFERQHMLKAFYLAYDIMACNLDGAEKLRQMVKQRYDVDIHPFGGDHRG